ncbi:MAG: S8 family serine peptidase [Firmicutes bacterium]|nr:S8 family serine peptidase [Bacillota bacterium]
MYPYKTIKAGEILKCIFLTDYFFLSDIIAGIDWAIKNKMQVINMSLGGSEDSIILQQALQKAVSAGITIVAAAGNNGDGGDGVDTMNYPAKYPEVISVGAIDGSEQVAAYSSRGSELDVVAPGSYILSTFNNGGYIINDGTSMATAHVTGEIADILSYNPQLNPIQIKAIVMQTATPLGPQTSYGSGLINVARAIANANQ